MKEPLVLAGNAQWKILSQFIFFFFYWVMVEVVASCYTAWPIKFMI